SGLDQQAGTRRPTDPGTALERSTCLDRFDRFRLVRGMVTQHTEALLSPYIPTVEGPFTG
ncbi:hypothetical protein ACWEP4_44790, partial [Streptomyces sp. NPDC004227]